MDAPGWPELTMVVAATLLLLLCLLLAWYCTARRRPTSERFEENEIDWVHGDADQARPLLDLALQRIAASRGADVRVGRNVKVVAAEKERVLDATASAVAADRWYRWRVEACFFRVDDPFAACEKLDVRARTAWGASTPPTEWPMQVASSRPITGGPPVTASP